MNCTNENLEFYSYIEIRRFPIILTDDGNNAAHYNRFGIIMLNLKFYCGIG